VDGIQKQASASPPPNVSVSDPGVGVFNGRNSVVFVERELVVKVRLSLSNREERAGMGLCGFSGTEKRRPRKIIVRHRGRIVGVALGLLGGKRGFVEEGVVERVLSVKVAGV
jgi:hypothetical protein